MACRVSELVIDAADPGRLAAFWSEVLGYAELGREDDGSIEIGRATDRDQDAELKRLLALGARGADVG
jgi:Glyoxalase-like domain